VLLNAILMTVEIAIHYEQAFQEVFSRLNIINYVFVGKLTFLFLNELLNHRPFFPTIKNQEFLNTQHFSITFTNVCNVHTHTHIKFILNFHLSKFIYF